VAEQIVLHIGLVDHLVLCAVKNLPDERLVGACARNLADGDLLEVDRADLILLAVSRRKREGKQHILIRQSLGKRPCAHIVSHKDEILRPAFAQRVENRVQLRIAQDDKNHIVYFLRFQFGHHRNAADRGAEGELILDPQPILPDFLRPVSPGKQGYIFSGAK